ncbi:aminotransferase-like domain-containing protein [Acinetobacter pittii]
MKIDKNSTVALYKQIVNEIIDGIRTGKLEPGAKLESERVLAENLSVNRMTVVKAYDELLAEGIIYRKKGSGTFIDERCKELIGLSAIKWDNYIIKNTFLPNQPFLTDILKNQQNSEFLNLSSDSCNQIFFKYEEFYQNLNFDNFKTFVSDVENQRKGNTQLRKSIAEYLAKYYSVHTTEKNILITSSIKQSLYLIIQCLLNPGDYIAIEESSYLFTLPILHSLKIRIIKIPMDSSGIIPEELEKLHLQYKIKLLIVNPILQAPTTSTMDNDRIAKILFVIEKYGIAVSEGSSYFLFADRKDIKPLKSKDKSNGILFLSSFEKVIPKYIGLSWIVAPENVLQKIEFAKSQIDFGVSIFTQIIGFNIMENEYFENDFLVTRNLLNAHMSNIYQKLYDELNFILNIEKPIGGYYLWCKFNKDINDNAFFHYMLKRKILISPSLIYGEKPGYFRINISYLDERNINLFISSIKEF